MFYPHTFRPIKKNFLSYLKNKTALDFIVRTRGKQEKVEGQRKGNGRRDFSPLFFSFFRIPSWIRKCYVHCTLSNNNNLPRWIQWIATDTSSLCAWKLQWRVPFHPPLPLTLHRTRSRFFFFDVLQPLSSCLYRKS